MDQEPHIFLSYSHLDSQIATELTSRLRDAGFECFVAEHDISPTEQWESTVRVAIRSAWCVLILVTPRSRNSTWVAIETGAAWVLEKNIVPATMFTSVSDLIDPMRRHQAFPVETNAQVTTLIQGLQKRVAEQKKSAASVASTLPPRSPTKAIQSPIPAVERPMESFTERGNWERLQKIGDWEMDEISRTFQGEGQDKYVLSHLSFGQRPFTITARIRFLSLRLKSPTNAVNAGIVFGFRSQGNVLRYYNLMFTGTRLLLELIGEQGGPVFRDYRHIDEGVPFTIETGRYYMVEVSVSTNNLVAKTDGREIYSVPFDGSPLGRVGLRPWRSRIESDRFDVQESAEN